MANPNAPFGFRPIKSLTGGELQVSYYPVASSASRIGKGDLVTLNSSGFIQRESSTLATGPWIGVSLADGGVPAAGGIAAHPVCADPLARFEVQALFTAAIAQTSVNVTYKVKCDTAVDTNTGNSKNAMTVTATTAATGVRLLKVINDPANEAASNQRVEVSINNHYAIPGTASV